MRKLLVLLGSMAALLTQAAPALAVSNVEVVIGCAPSKVAPDDPILLNGQPGASHPHAFFGAKGIDAASTPATLQGTPTSCKTPGQTSAYWIPVANFPSFRLGVYYSNRFSPRDVAIVPFGAELVIGNGHVAADGKSAVFWTCSGAGEVGTGIQKAARPLRCSEGRDTLVVRFPNCWDGALEPFGVKDNAHFAYSSGGSATEPWKIATGATTACPAGFPVELAQTNAHFRFRNPYGVAVSSFSSGGVSTAHGDFMQSWVTASFQRFVDTCLNDPTKADCTGVF